MHDEDAARQVTCPTCMAVSGEPCIASLTDEGFPLKRAHISRVLRARKRKDW